MESEFRAALIAWLRSSSELAAMLNRVEEEHNIAASPPWLGIVASASTDWSTKTRAGRELRLAMECITRADQPRTTAANGSAGGSEEAGESAIITALERRILAMPRAQPAFYLVNTQFLRARSEKRQRNIRAALVEYRFRLLAPAA